MMFANKFVLAVKVNGKILRENKDIVTLPFGCEYELVLKNLNSRRAMVNVSVDGKDATDGRLVLGPNQSITLERSINNGNLSSGNRFKFIERTPGIEAHRGIKADDGLIRAEFWAEREVITRPIIRTYPDWLPDGRRRGDYPRPFGDRRRSGMPTRSSGITGQSVGGFRSFTDTSSYNETSCSLGGTADAGLEQGELCKGGIISPQSSMNMAQSTMMDLNDAGITVPGSESRQQFVHVSGFELEPSSSVIVLQLKGEIAGVAVPAPVTVDLRPVCQTCGRRNKGTSRYCSQCGTSLIIL